MTIVDRRADELQKLALRGGKDPGTAPEREGDLRGQAGLPHPCFEEQVGRALRSLYEQGARASLAGLLGR